MPETAATPRARACVFAAALLAAVTGCAAVEPTGLSTGRAAAAPGADVDPTADTQAVAGAHSTPRPTAAAPPPGTVVRRPSGQRKPAPTKRAARLEQPVVPLGAATAASGYVRTRLSYRYDDPAGYAAALSATAWATPGFAARSRPGRAALARLQVAQETSSVRVGAVELAAEAPHSARSCYVTVRARATVGYRGAATAQVQDALWTLRLLRTGGSWRVDAVLSTS